MADTVTCRPLASDGLAVSERLGTGGTVVLLHGIPGCGNSWSGVTRLLSDDLHVLVPDLLGFGNSKRSDDIQQLHAAGQAQLLQAVLSPRLTAPSVLVGHDFGGPVAVELLRRMPDAFAGLVLVSTNVFPDTPIPFPLSLVRAPSFLGWAASRALFSQASLRMLSHRGSGGRANVPASVGDVRQARAIRKIFVESLRRLDELYRPIADYLHEVYIPTVVVWGSCDPFFPPEQADRTASAIEGAELLILDGGKHFLPEEQPSAVAQVIERLCSQVAGDAVKVAG